MENIEEKEQKYGAVSTCAQCENYIQYDGHKWFHVNGTIPHAAFPPRTANLQRADLQLKEQLANERQPLESATAVDTFPPPAESAVEEK